MLSTLRPSLLTAIVTLTVLAAMSGLAELRPFSSLAVGDREKFGALEAKLVQPGISYYSQGLLLDTCLNAMTSIYGRLQSAVRRRFVADQCRDLAAEITRKSPTYSYAWLIEAQAAQELGDTASRDRALLRSQATASSEIWLSELRFLLFEGQFSALSPEVQANADKDLMLLLSTMRGRAVVIRRFINAPESRERITQMVERLSEDFKARFLDEMYGHSPGGDYMLGPDGGMT